MNTDPRYKALEGYSIDEVELLTSNSVMQKLNDLPDFKESGYGPDKHLTEYKLYVRPILSWSFECETRSTNQITRENALLYITHDV